MIEGLQPYSQYKESGQRWLGRVPPAWNVLPLCRVAAVKSESGRPDLELLSVYLNRGVIRYSESSGQVHKPSLDLSKYQVVDPGDFVLNNQQAWRGSIGVSRYRGIISPAYVIMRLSPRLHPEYANFMFRSPTMVAQWVVASRGVGDIQRNLYYPDLRGSLVPVPPLDEQAAIVRFLDHSNRKIDGFIRAKRKLIGLLNEQKQAIIHRAVTRGLNPAAPLKPSGIRWLGDIPEQWEQRALWTLSKLRVEKNPGNLTLLSVFLDRGVIRYEEGGGQVHAPSLDLSNYQVVHVGDFVLNNQQAWRGSVGVSAHNGIISPAYIVLKMSPQLRPAYANYLMRSRAMVDQFVAASKGVGDIQRQVFWPFLRMVQVPVPALEEQDAIVNFLAAETKALRQAITRTEREIALMQEYRTRLTADVVTGKLDVRAAAAKLPDLPADNLESAGGMEENEPGESET